MVYDLEQYSKKSNLIIRGIPYDEKEDLYVWIEKLANKLEINIQLYHICAIHRLLSRQAIPPIVVMLNNFNVKRELITRAKKRKLIARDFGAGNSPIYVNEHLSAYTMSLLNEAKKQRDLGMLKYV